MASVTFPVGLGGDGSTVTDDSNATTGLGNGGHRARFVPALNQTVAMANTAVNSASTATTQAASATASASSASTSATNANNSFLSMDTKYLGSKTGDPTVNNQGGALTTGAEYWNSSTSTMRVYNGTSWLNSSALTDFASNTFRVSDNTDSTKKVAINTSGITTGTVRTLTIPNVNGTVITSGDTGTVTATLLANTAVTGGSYGSATQVGTFTVDAQGRLTAASNTSIQITESQVTNLTTDLGLKAPLASPTFTGTVTTPTITTTGTTGLTLNNGTSNLIYFNTNGVGAPTFSTRSVGTKLVLYPGVNATNVDAAFGIDTGNVMWSSIFTSGGIFKWYGGTTVAATLTGTGDLTTTGTVSGSSATGFRNKLINGDFQIWQGGTSFTNPTSNATAYGPDQWQFTRGGMVSGITATQQQTQTASKGIRIQRTAGDTSTQPLYLNTPFETIDVVKLAGKTVTLQYKIKKGANYSDASSINILTAYYGTGTDSTLTAGFTGITIIGSITPTLTTSLQQFTYTFTIPSNATQFSFQFYYSPTGTAGANDWFEITDVQLEEGSVATPIERRPYGLELSLCQRYYYQFGGANAYEGVAQLQAYSSTNALGAISLPVSMRTVPTLSYSSLIEWMLISSNGTTITPTAIGLDAPTSSTKVATVTVTVATGLTGGNSTMLRAANAINARLILSARL